MNSTNSNVLKCMRGQVALIVLLISTVVMTIGLSLSKKTVIETRVDIDEELLKKAFNAAESAVDYYLGQGEVNYNSGDASVATVDVTDIGNTDVIDYGEYTVAGGVTTYWLVGHDENDEVDVTLDPYDGSKISVCWASGFSGAVKIDYFYLDGAGVYKVARQVYNVNSAGAVTGAENIDEGNSSCSGGRGVDVAVTGTTPLLLAVKPLINGTRLSIEGDGIFPKVGEEIVSEGSAGDVDSNEGVVVRRRVTVQKRFPVPAFMIDALTSRTSIYRD